MPIYCSATLALPHLSIFQSGPVFFWVIQVTNWGLDEDDSGPVSSLEWYRHSSLLWSKHRSGFLFLYIKQKKNTDQNTHTRAGYCPISEDSTAIIVEYTTATTTPGG